MLLYTISLSMSCTVSTIMNVIYQMIGYIFIDPTILMRSELLLLLILKAAFNFSF